MEQFSSSTLLVKVWTEKKVHQYLTKWNINIYWSLAILLPGKCLQGTHIHSPKDTYNNIQRSINCNSQNSVTNTMWSVHATEYYTAGVSQLFCKGPDSNIFGFAGSMVFVTCNNYSSLPLGWESSHKQYVNE